MVVVVATRVAFTASYFDVVDAGVEDGVLGDCFFVVSTVVMKFNVIDESV